MLAYRLLRSPCLSRQPIPTAMSQVAAIHAIYAALGLCTPRNPLEFGRMVGGGGSVCGTVWEH